MRFSALQVYSPMSALVALLSFRQATPFVYSNLQVGLDLTLPSALNQDTLISGVPPTWHFRHTASPAVTSMGSRNSTKYAGSEIKTKKQKNPNSNTRKRLCEAWHLLVNAGTAQTIWSCYWHNLVVWTEHVTHTEERFFKCMLHVLVACVPFINTWTSEALVNNFIVFCSFVFVAFLMSLNAL